MAVRNKDLPRFSIVNRNPHLKRLLLAALLLWLLLAGAWLWLLWLLWRGTDTDAGHLRTQLADARGQLEQAAGERDALKQQLANAKRAEFITRSANNQVQQNLADKDEQIAGLKADLDFYERLVGSGARRQGLNVHSAAFAPEQGGAWRYTITLTQNINRGGMSAGQMRFAIEGVQAGKLKSLDWDTLIQKQGAPGQAFSFRYFQELQGSVLLPPGFTPQRLKVGVKGPFGSREQAFEWAQVRVRADVAQQTIK